MVAVGLEADGARCRWYQALSRFATRRASAPPASGGSSPR